MWSSRVKTTGRNNGVCILGQPILFSTRKRKNKKFDLEKPFHPKFSEFRTLSEKGGAKTISL